MSDDEFVAMFLMQRPTLLRVARAIVGQDESEDAVSEAFVRAWRRRATFDGRAGGGWLATITKNWCLDQLRRRARRARLVATVGDGALPWRPDRAPGPEAACLAREAEDALLAAILALPQSLAPVVLLMCAQGLDQREAMAALGLSQAALKMRAYRGRQLLRARLATG